MERRLLPIVILATTLIAAGCTSAPRRSDNVIVPVVIEQGQETPGTRVARTAVEYAGVPYKYGGDTPRGFDCSGLVFYSYQKVGFDVPRTAAAQSSAARPITLDALRPGDLVFFRVKSKEVDHVGIYLGGGRFIHAPRNGRVVSAAYLDDPYYRTRLSGAGRLW
jgi:cell wall-associated NlpC family hydrolase